MKLAAVALLGLLLAAGSAASAAETATATIAHTGSGPTYHYSVTLNDTGTTTVGTLWFAWVPGLDFLNNAPTNVTSPSGWNGLVTNEPGGYGIEWYAISSSFYLNSNHSLSGFAFDSLDTPAVIAGPAYYYPTYPITTSYIYAGQPLSDVGYQFVVAQAVPEPASLLALALGGLALLFRRSIFRPRLVPQSL